MLLDFYWNRMDSHGFLWIPIGFLRIRKYSHWMPMVDRGIPVAFLGIPMNFEWNSMEFYAFLLQASYGHSYCIPIAFLWAFQLTFLLHSYCIPIAFLPLFVIIVAPDVTSHTLAQ